jgi:DUF1680 family protein
MSGDSAPHTSAGTTAVPVAATAFGVVTPLGEGSRLGDGALGRWQRRNRETTIPYGIEQLEASGAVDNLRRVAGRADAAFRGPVFADSDVHKTLEALAWELGHGDDPALRSFYDATVELLEAAQDADGYLDSAFQIPGDDRDPRADHAAEHPREVRARWTDFAFGHELYCAGHLIQAAVAAVRSLGDERLLGVATRVADLIVRRFGVPDSPVYPGHPEVEYALVELSRLTGRREYLDTASAFIDRRGAGWLGEDVFGRAYYQDDAPLRETTIMRGHAVRALYLASGAADVYLETGDPTLLRALEAQWDDLVTRRSYVTGGTGSRHRDEAFGDAYELPSDRAYAETCAGIAVLHWAWRMYLATGGAKYGDFFETALYNVVADGIGERGDCFFYSNPLQLRADHLSVQEEAAAHRLDWYFCACCPPNLMRTFASLEGYLAGVREAVGDTDELQVMQYTRSRLEAVVGETRVLVDVDTDYPVDGRVRLTVIEGFAESSADSAGTLALRMPGWCRDARVAVNGAGARVAVDDADARVAVDDADARVAVDGAGARVAVDGSAIDLEVHDGWLRLPGALVTGTIVELELDLTPQVLVADDRVDAVRGAVAVRRGPVVYCAEQRDNPAEVDRIAIDPASSLTETGETTELGPVLRAAGTVTDRGEDDALYSTWGGARPAAHPVELRLRPYATWGNGDPGAMRVWIPVAR